MNRLGLAIVTSTLVATLVAYLIIYIPVLLSDEKTSYPSDIAAAILLAYAFSIFIGVLIVGMPVHLLLTHYAITSVVPYALTGFIVPSIAIFIFEPFGADPLKYLIRQAVISSVPGVICASVFWYITVKADT